MSVESRCSPLIIRLMFFGVVSSLFAKSSCVIPKFSTICLDFAHLNKIFSSKRIHDVC